MKISFRILLINFLIVVIILASSYFFFYTITYDVLTSFQTRNLRQSTNSFTYVYRSLQNNTEDDFFSLYNRGVESLFTNQKLQTKNVDFILELKNTNDNNISRYLVKPNVYLPKTELTLREFFNFNPSVVLMSFTNPDGTHFIYGRIMSDDILDEIAHRINSDVALIWDGNPISMSNHSTNLKYSYVLTQAVDDLKNKGNFELFLKGTESNDILATICEPVSINKQENLSFIIFSNFSEAGDLRNTVKGVFLIIGLVGILLSLIFTFLFTGRLRKQITELGEATETTYSGDFKHKITIKSKDEIGKLGIAFNRMLDELEKKEKAKNDYAEFITLINQNPTLKEISDEALKKIIDKGDFLVGGLYDIDEKITLISSYGVTEKFQHNNEFSDFIKKVLETKQSLEIFNENNLPVVSAGLVDIKIKYLLFLPIIYNNKPVALLELGSLNKPTEEILDYLQKIKDQLAVGVTNAKALTQLENLVNELKKLNEDYQKQNEQIKEQNETLLYLHDELRIQAGELEKQKLRAEELTEVKSRFLANMSHELRTPMNSILGLTELMLEKTEISQRNKERLAVVLNSGKRLMNLINDILDLSKIEAGKVEMRYEEVILDELLSEVSNGIAPLANDKGVSFRVVKSIDTRMVINTDRGKVVQVLVNLLGNAVKFTDQGEVTLKTSVENSMLTFDVIDTGIGIGEEELKIIFEEFRQFTGPNNKKRGGTGLGLAISKKLAEILGGNLSVKSKLNKGSTFTFSIPLKQVEIFPSASQEASNVSDMIKSEAEEQEFQEEKVSPLKNFAAEVLIVDDDPDTLFTLDELVQASNCKTILAKGGKECLDILERKIPDLILLDIIMPEMDGFQVLKQIKRNSKWTDIPVFAVTAKAMKEDNEIILKHGFSDYIPKPVNPSIVSHKIQKIITQLKTA
jgi:two-component system chemotaxis sensor kinase CheA